MAKGGRHTRKVNAWAKAAGEYYRAHKNDPDISEFRDVLKSPKFKSYYQSKYGKFSKKTTNMRFGKFNKNRTMKKMDNEEEKEMEEEDEKEMEEKEEEEKEEDEKEMEEKEEEEYEEKKPKGKKMAKKMAKKESSVSDWGEWAWGKKEVEKPKKKSQVKDDYFNGGKKK
jgi:hypothetical protein